MNNVTDNVMNSIIRGCKTEARKQVRAELSKLKKENTQLKDEVKKLKEKLASPEMTVKRLEKREAQVKLAAKRAINLLDDIEKLRNKKIASFTFSYEGFCERSDRNAAIRSLRKLLEKKK